MIVGTWASNPAPAISPIAAPSFRCEDGVLHVSMKIEAPGTAFAADPGEPGAAERGAQVPDEEAVDPHGPRDQPAGHSIRPVMVAGEQGGRQPVRGAVGQFYRLVLAAEGLHGEHRAEDLLGEDPRARSGAREQCRLVVQAAERGVTATT